MGHSLSIGVRLGSAAQIAVTKFAKAKGVTAYSLTQEALRLGLVQLGVLADDSLLPAANDLTEITRTLAEVSLQIDRLQADMGTVLGRSEWAARASISSAVASGLMLKKVAPEATEEAKSASINLHEEAGVKR